MKLITDLLINKPATFFPTNFYVQYLLFLSRLLHYKGYDSPRSIRKNQVEISEIGPVPLYKVTFFSGLEIWIINPIRMNRLLRGIDRAGKRLWDRYLLNTFSDFTNTGTWIDVGANIGELSLYLSKRFSFVYAVEPDPIARYCLTQNMQGTRNCAILPFALGMNDGEMPLGLKSDSADSSLHNPDSCSNRVVLVKVFRGDDVFRNLIETKVKLYLKMDAEGYEPEVLMGLERILGSIDFISIDAGKERGGEDTVYECRRLLDQAGLNSRSNKFWIVTAT